MCVLLLSRYPFSGAYNMSRSFVPGIHSRNLEKKNIKKKGKFQLNVLK
jgi:hypothetical protein